MLSSSPFHPISDNRNYNLGDWSLEANSKENVQQEIPSLFIQSIQRKKIIDKLR
jgi:hypothetical protein